MPSWPSISLSRLEEDGERAPIKQLIWLHLGIASLQHHWRNGSEDKHGFLVWAEMANHAFSQTCCVLSVMLSANIPGQVKGPWFFLPTSLLAPIQEWRLTGLRWARFFKESVGEVMQTLCPALLIHHLCFFTLWGQLSGSLSLCVCLYT